MITRNLNLRSDLTVIKEVWYICTHTPKCPIKTLYKLDDNILIGCFCSKSTNIMLKCFMNERPVHVVQLKVV